MYFCNRAMEKQQKNIRKGASKYYSLPFSFGLLMEQKDHPGKGLKESVAQYIHLIATTYLGECRYDTAFGCSIWDYDFVNSMTDIKLKNILKESLHEAITKNETRIKDLAVNVSISQVSISLKNTTRLKKKIDVTLQAKLVKTNEDFQYFEYFYLGPLSYY